MSVVIFIIILAVLVLVHEFGHFIVAKKSGIRVDEFGLGFPPRLWSITRGETIYSLNAIPFGGFVKIFGENPSDESISGPDSERSFVHKSKWIQVAVLIAGVTVNIIFAWFLFSLSFSIGAKIGASDVDMHYVSDRHVIIDAVIPNKPASKASLHEGDEVLSINANGVSFTPTSVEEIQTIVKESKGSELILHIKEGAKEKDVSVRPEKNTINGIYAVGISLNLVGTVRYPLYLAIWEGGRMVVNLFSNITSGLFNLIAGMVSGTADYSQVSGPIGIAKYVGEARDIGFSYLLSFVGFISLNLAVLNLLPFPALDGGRILFVIIEAIKRSPIKPKVANTINAIGFGILIILMIVVTFKDIIKLF